MQAVPVKAYPTGSAFTGACNHYPNPEANNDGILVRIERDLSVTAKSLAEIAPLLPLFYHRGKIVFIDHLQTLQMMTGMRFRTWINHNGVITYAKTDEVTGEPVRVSLSCGDAAAILEDDGFRRRLKPLPAALDEEGGEG